MYLQKNQFISSVHFWGKVNFTVPWPDLPHPYSTMPTQKDFDQILLFVNLYQHAKIQFIPSVHSSDTVNFIVLAPDWPYLFLVMPIPKFVPLNLYQHAKGQLISSVPSWDTVSFRVQRPNLPHPYFDHTQPKKFPITFNFGDFVSTCKNEAVSSIYFGKIVDSKILQSNWLRAFWSLPYFRVH